MHRLSYVFFNFSGSVLTSSMVIVSRFPQVRAIIFEYILPDFPLFFCKKNQEKHENQQNGVNLNERTSVQYRDRSNAHNSGDPLCFGMSYILVTRPVAET